VTVAATGTRSESPIEKKKRLAIIPKKKKKKKRRRRSEGMPGGAGRITGEGGGHSR